MNSATSTTEHVKSLVNFYLDTRSEGAVTLMGLGSVVLLRDFLDSLGERGGWVVVVGAAPSAAKQALTAWADALGVDWPLTHPLVLSAATVESNEDPRQAPAMDIETIRKLEVAAAYVEILIQTRRMPMVYSS